MDKKKWTKIDAGFYHLEGTRYAVASMNAMDEEGMNFITRMEWAVVRLPEHDGEVRIDSQAGENIDWHDTMREARAHAERLAS